MKTILTFAFFAFTAFSFAQTDIIEMRSRGRTLKKYERSDSYRMSKMSGDHVPSNFGLDESAYQRIEAPTHFSVVHVDSVEALSDSTTVMYTSEYLRPVNYFPEYELEYFDSLGQPLKEPIKGKLKPYYGELVKMGVDTFQNHFIFANRHSLDSIKMLINNGRFYALPADSIKFIGFDNEQGFSNEDAVQPVQQNREQKNNGFGWELLFMIVTPIVFLLGMSKLRIAKS